MTSFSKLMEVYREKSDAYHLICNMISKDRHVTEHFSICIEETCKLAIDFINSMEQDEPFFELNKEETIELARMLTGIPAAIPSRKVLKARIILAAAGLPEMQGKEKNNVKD